MGIISKMRKQKAVYWSFASIDAFGDKQYDSAIEISCRWEDISQEYIDAQGEKKISNSIVYVDRDMSVGDLLMLGDLEDIDNSAFDSNNPLDNNGVWEIKKSSKVPDLKAKEFLRMVYL